MTASSCRRFGVVTVAVVALVALTPACSKAQSGSSAGSPTISSALGRPSDPGGAATAPEGWPADVPVPADFSPLADNRVAMGDEVTITWAGTTKASVAEVDEFYRKGLAGWEPGDSGTVEGQPANSYLGFRRGNERLMVNIADADGERTLNLSYTVAG